ncbi:MAG TPA: hypothetical protein VJ302_03420 [Blastocatellia bacterium]|nr:hypothetical protein [Blastocatellia bacterium]
MFHRFTVFRRRQQEVTPSAIGAVSINLEMPAGFEGRTVPAGTVVRILLWQQYGLDLLHPEVGRWLEQHAPDVKYAVARNRAEQRAELKIGPQGTIRLSLSTEVEGRLREVSSDYLLSHVRPSKSQKRHQAA